MAGSTTSEASCQAVRMACKELVERMRPFVTKGASWQDVCRAAMPGYAVGFREDNATFILHRAGMPSKALMSAYAFYDGAAQDGSGAQLDYHSYGACLAEVLIDTITGACAEATMQSHTHIDRGPARAAR